MVSIVLSTTIASISQLKLADERLAGFMPTWTLTWKHNDLESLYGEFV